MSINPGRAAIAAPTQLTNEIEASPEEIRRLSLDKTHAGIRERQWGILARLDRSVTFEEFTHWAKVERELEIEENQRHIPAAKGGMFGFLKGKAKESDDGTSHAIAVADDHGQHTEKPGTLMHKDGDTSPIPPPSNNDLTADWRKASRALRTVGWGNIFFLITTDILGWGQTPYAFSNTGYGLGAGMFVIMGIAAAFSGWMIWKVFLALDSARYPMVSFGDPFFRLFGPKCRHFINILQAIQMFLMVTIIMLSQSGILYQLANPDGNDPKVCFIGLAVVSLVVCMAGGYMRSLKAIGWFANSAVWINVMTFIIIMAAAGLHPPDPTFAVNSGPMPKIWATHPAPVTTFVGTPPNPFQPTNTDLFAAQFSGVNTITYAFSGAILFIAFLSEMRHPLDFWKGVFLAQFFITSVYLLFGLYVYSRFGQYSYVNISQVVSPVSLQIVSNVFSLFTGWLAVWMYFNVGLKTIYVEVGQEVFGLPPIASKKGKWFWLSLGPIYWIIGFVFSMSVPQFAAFSNFVGGLFGFNFTYSFSGMMFIALQIQEGARLPGEGFDPNTGITTRHDSGMKRWARGFFKNWYLTIPVLLFTLAGLAASGMGTWSGTEALITAFSTAVSTSWSCKYD